MAVNLTGNYRGTDESVSYNDKPVTNESKVALKQTHGYNLIRNPNIKGIDTIHTDRRGGNENEAGKWIGHYLEQPCINFNQFTLPFPTYNIPQERKALGFTYNPIPLVTVTIPTTLPQNK